MNSSDITKSSPINLQNVDPKNYTFTLINEGYNAMLINANVLSKLQSQLMQIVNELITKFTKGESSSTRIDIHIEFS